MYRDPRGTWHTRYEAWSLEAFREDKHRKKHPKRRKKHARAGTPGLAKRPHPGKSQIA
jgi:hypothetical protein